MTEDEFNALEAWVAAVAKSMVHGTDYNREQLEDCREHARKLFLGPKCRVCGCTNEDCSRCIERTGEACSWAEDDLCTACTPAVLKRFPLPTKPPASLPITCEQMQALMTYVVDCAAAQNDFLLHGKRYERSRDAMLDKFGMRLDGGSSPVLPATGKGQPMPFDATPEPEDDSEGCPCCGGCGLASDIRAGMICTVICPCPAGNPYREGEG